MDFLWRRLFAVHGWFDDDRAPDLLDHQRTSGLQEHHRAKNAVRRRRMFPLLSHRSITHSFATIRHVTHTKTFPEHSVFTFFNPSTYIAAQPTSWIDDFKDWSETSGCCKYFYSNNSFCPHTHDGSLCGSCAIANFPDMTWEEYFEKYLPYFLNDNPDTSCAKAGHASYVDVSFLRRKLSPRNHFPCRGLTTILMKRGKSI